MRYLLYVVLLCLFLCSCSKSPGDVEPPAPPILDFSEDPKEDVAAWNTEDFIFDRYYSLIDTMWVVSIPSVTVKYSENSIITITWTVNQKTMANIEVGKLWNENIAKWISTNKLDIGDQKLVPGDHIKAVITIGSNTIIREATIGENKIITDVLGITFGTSKAVVEEKERARVRPYPGSNLYADFPLYEYKSNTAVMFYSTNIRTGTYDGMTIYRFSNGRLSQVGEYTTVIETTDILLNYCRKLGLKETPVITSGEFDQTYVWDNGKIEFCLSIIEDAPPLSPSSPTLRRAIGISYRKL